MGAFFRWIFSAIGQLLFDRWGTANAQAVVRMLAVSVERNVPVAPVLEALADEEGGFWRLRGYHFVIPLLIVRVAHEIGSHGSKMRLQKLADLLTSGTPIPEALDSIPGLLPEEALATIRVGFDVGRPAEALREVADYLGRQSESKARVTGGTLAYLACVTLVGTLLLTFIAIWIIPKLKAIFAGFDSRLPPLTSWLIDGVFQSTANYWYLVAGPVGLIALVMLIAGGFFSELLRQGVFWRPRTWLSMLVPRIHTPLLLRCLGLAVDGGRPISGALTCVAANSRDRYLQQQLGVVSSRIDSGEETWQVLHQSRFITRREMSVFAASARMGNLGWALRQTALAQERQSSARMRFLIDCARPLVLLAMGAVVGLISVALFLPIVQMIQEMS